MKRFAAVSWVSALCLLGGAVACADSTSKRDAPAVSNTFDAGGAEWTVVPDLRLGNSDKPEEMITDISGLKISKDRTIYVMQPRDHVIRVFSGDGHWVRNIGREGQGPGEFVGFGFFGFNEDSLWITDPNQNRVSLFAMDGTFIRYLTTSVNPPDARYGPAPPLAYLSDGSLLVRFRPVENGAPRDPMQQPPDLIMRASSAGALRDTIRVFDLRRPIPTYKVGADEFPMSQPVSDAPYLVMAADGSQAVIVERPPVSRPDSAAFTIVRVGADGKVISEVRYQYTPRPVSQEVVDSLYPLLPDSAPKAARERAQARREHAYFPKSLPPLNKTIVGRDGTLWLANDWGADRYRWTILDSDNTIIAHTMLPKGFRLLQADRDYVWGSEVDADDVPYVTRYRVVRGS